MAKLERTRPDDMTQIETARRETALRGPQDRVSTNMLFALGSYAHYSGGYWDHQELEEYTLDADWIEILKSITDGKNEYEMVNGNSVRKTTL